MKQGDDLAAKDHDPHIYTWLTPSPRSLRQFVSFTAFQGQRSHLEIEFGGDLKTLKHYALCLTLLLVREGFRSIAPLTLEKFETPQNLDDHSNLSWNSGRCRNEYQVTTDICRQKPPP
ncbi:hypothetical protein AB1N83_009010 [Pleurotus pulmonarius]